MGLVPQHATRAGEEAMGLWDWCHNVPQGLRKKLWGCGTGATRAGEEAMGLVPQGLREKLWGWCHNVPQGLWE